ncbi:MAG: hypothetical protein H6733_12415 [Alphaproteobacteria bacterium]|nr:hypothetical protein [Alphaproteobacteria bacterium]
MPMSPAAPPFAGWDEVAVVVPTDLAHLSDDDAYALERLPLQLETEAAAIAAELGARPRVVDVPPAAGPVWFLGPTHANPHLAALGQPAATHAEHRLDRGVPRLVSDGPDAAAVLATFSTLRSLARLPGGVMPVTDAASITDVVARVITEVHDTWAGARLRGIDWLALSRRHALRVRGSTNPVEALQRWLAELGDFHTWVRPAQTQLVLPYGATVVDGEVVLTHVMPWTEAWSHGVRPGWRLVGEDVRSTWVTTPAAPHARPGLVARRLLSGTAGATRALEARGPRGAWARWSEVFTPPTGTPASWEVLPSGAGYLWIGAWIPALGVPEVLDEAFVALADCDRLIVDLRGNSGGRLAMAQAFRDRFLDAPTRAGWIRTTQPGGRLGPYVPLDAEPFDGPRWHKPVRFLTSPLSYSSSEDALLGLQGLPHVQVWGAPSGGGSGRIRRLRLLPGWRLTISSALTFDRRGHCVEGAGIPVDHPVRVDPRAADGTDVVLTAADTTPW